MVSPTEWGPNAWNLLHGIAEYVGTSRNMTIAKDEKNEIRLTLRNFGSLLPCKTCQNHYREWLQKNPPELFLKEFGDDLRNGMRRWVWQLHENVNHTREDNLRLTSVTYESLSTLYSSVDLRRCALNLKSIYTRGIELRILKPEEWKVGWKHLDLLLRFMGR